MFEKYHAQSFLNFISKGFSTVINDLILSGINLKTHDTLDVFKNIFPCLYWMWMRKKNFSPQKIQKIIDNSEKPLIEWLIQITGVGNEYIPEFESFYNNDVKTYCGKFFSQFDDDIDRQKDLFENNFFILRHIDGYLNRKFRTDHQKKYGIYLNNEIIKKLEILGDDL